MRDESGRVETPIFHKGVFVDVVVNMPHSHLAGVKARGLIDTGADFVLISLSLARKLKLRHVNDEEVAGIGGEVVTAKIYPGSISVPHLKFAKVLPLYAVPWGATTHTVLLGRTFLKYFVFRYDGPSNVFHFSAPLDGGYQPSSEDG